MNKEVIKKIKELEVEIAYIKHELSKTDRHTFKVGDWVKPPNEDYQRIYKITDKSVHVTDFRDINTSIGINTNTYNKLELWKPTEGEWCVFCQRDNPFNTYRVAQYYNKNIKNGYYMVKTHDNANEGYKCIFPLEFVNTLKDN